MPRRIESIASPCWGRSSEKVCLRSSIVAILVGLVFCSDVALCQETFPYQTPQPGAQNARANALGLPSTRIDEKTTWTFRAYPDAQVTSGVIRMGDIAEPLDSGMGSWPRLSRKVIGLVPVGESSLTLDRDRIADLLRSVEAVPRVIRWVGPEKIHVRVVKANHVGGDAGSRSNVGSRIKSLRVSHDGSAETIDGGRVQQAKVPLPTVDAATSGRLQTWVQLALGREQPEISKRFDLKLASMQVNQESLGRLSEASGVIWARLNEQQVESALASSNSPEPAVIRATVDVAGRSVHGTIDAQLEILLDPHPMVVASTQPLRRGHRLRASDLQLIPLREERWKEDFSGNLEDFVGLEVQASVRAGQPLSGRALARPMLIRRGELIELHVAGGSVLVTTNAKAQSDGRESELIEVETIQPKRRLVARVTGIGVAEITTRAPIVRSR